MKVFKRTIKDRFEHFKSNSIDGEISDFAEQEIEQYKKRKFPNGYPGTFGIVASSSYRSEYTYFGHKCRLICQKEIFEQIERTQNNKIKYLITLKERNKFDDIEIGKSEPEIFLDYSDNSQAERIVFLYELGILKYLEDKMINELHRFSANKLAEIISTFTGIDQKTAQSYLNPIYSTRVIQDNNPLTKKNLEKVKNKLKDIGFKTSKSA